MYVLVTCVAAITAALAAALSQQLSLPVWAMFVGWIAFFTQGLDARNAIENLACVWAGLVIGALASLAIQSLAPHLGAGLTLPVVVFVVASFVVALRGLPRMRNLLAYFLGLVAWFASHLEPAPASLGILLAATAIGSAAAWIAHTTPSRLARAAS